MFCDRIEAGCRPGVREPAEAAEAAEDFDWEEERPLLLETGLADSYVSLPESGCAWPRAMRANGERWSSSLSETFISTGTELIELSDSDVCIVVAEWTD